VVDSIQKGSLGVYAHIVGEINEAKQEFQDLSFVHKRICSNKEPHHLARSVVNLDQGRRVLVCVTTLWRLYPHDYRCLIKGRWFSKKMLGTTFFFHMGYPFPLL
jgi:hypothetical protein